MKKFLLLLPLMLLAFCANLTAQNAQPEIKQATKVKFVESQSLEEQKASLNDQIQKLEDQLAEYKVLIKKPAYATEQEKIQHNINATEQKTVELNKKLEALINESKKSKEK